MTDNHSFNTTFATKYGIEEAIIFDHIYFWCISNKRNGNNAKRLDNEDIDRYWTFNSYKYFSETFPYINESKVRRVIKRLEELGFLLIANFNKVKYDQTNWYSVTQTGEEEYVKCCSNLSTTLFQIDNSHLSNCKKDGVKMTDEAAQNERPIPTSNTTSNTTSNHNDNNFPQPEDFKKESKKKSSFSKSDYTECYKLITSCQNTLRAKGIQIDETKYSIPALNRWFKKFFSEYGVEETKKGIKNSLSNSWLINSTHYSLSALFSDKIFPKLINNQSFTSSSVSYQNHAQIDYMKNADDMKTGQEF